ncbi:nitrite reductase small subunit NirD [Cryobacterium sp. SO2]|uniref:nitrite reductase small subunit NirD n=1 Tax=Cryobacterium sp. SO2 TaxID=1897060 RepID=UPI00223D708D|nr:nitrite reductase small subunit NirD [Cryobacterium sp. SO2]WEO78578.1 nitrite reductase small subunit NirD [Cryobacterium sp. SO2]
MQTTTDSHDSTGTAAEWTSVCDFDRLEPLWGEAALIDGVQIALVLLPDGSLFAVSNQDPATGSFVMSRGIVGSRGARPTLASPLHKQVYDLETGECFTSADYALRTFPVRVDHGTVQIQVHEQAQVNEEAQLGTAAPVDVEFAAA